MLLGIMHNAMASKRVGSTLVDMLTSCHVDTYNVQELTKTFSILPGPALWQ